LCPFLPRFVGPPVLKFIVVVDVFTYLNAAMGVGFLSLGALAAWQWRRRGDPPSPYIALALASLGIIVLIGLEEDIAGEQQSEVLEFFSLVLFMASAYFLLLFRHSIIPLARVWRIVLTVAVVASLVVLLVHPLPESDHPDYTPLELVILFFVIGTWSFCIGEPAITFWRVSRSRPLVQRTRLRALSGAYVALILIIFVAVFASIGGQPTGVQAITTISVLLLIPVLWTAFAPPQWMRRAWRAREEEFRLIEDLAVYAVDRHEIAQRALNRALRLAGADGGFIVSTDEIIAVEGIDTTEARRLLDIRSVQEDPQRWTEAGGQNVVIFSLRSEEGEEAMGLVSGRMAPVFGSDELRQLSQYAELVGVALARVRLVEELRDQTESNEALLHAISDLGEGFVVTQNGRLDYANEAYLRMTGYTFEELKGLPSLLELSLPEEREALAERMRRRLAGGQVSDHYEAGFLTKDGRRIDAEVAVKLLQTPSGPRVISIIRDVTERKRAEAFRSQFIQNAAHELRTPTTAMVGFADLLDSRRGELDEQEMTSISEALNRQGERLRVLVANLLDITRLQEGRIPLKLEALGLGEVLTEVLQSNPAPENKSVAVESPMDITVLADKLRLEQILTNLLVNAYRYGGRRIAVDASTNGDGVLVSVSDDGPGVPGNLMPSLFEPFSRGEDATKVGGSGLGLAIVRMMARAQGGDVWYDGREQAGAKFVFKIPRA
jgi:PAS domain S-box-containing protein